MKAVVLDETGLSLKDYVLPECGSGQSRIDLRYMSLNHRDVFITQGLYAGIRYPIVLGSDGSGIIEGKQVLLNPSVNWYSDKTGQPGDFEIIGLPRDGTLRQAGHFDTRLIHDIPDHLSMEEASALPLAGLTAYRVVFSRCGVKAGDRVLVTGIGGGVALFAAQFAMAAGAEVWVTSGKDDKLEKARSLGIKGGRNYKEEGWHKKLMAESGGFDVIIDSAGGPGFANLLVLANAGARIGIYGGNTGKLEGVSPQIIFWKQLNILGSTMGNHTEFAEMLGFVTTHRIRPVIDSVFQMQEYKAAFDRMATGQQFGKIVISLT